MARLRATHLVLSCGALTVLLTGCSGFGPTKKGQRTYTVDGKVTALSATTQGGNIEIVPIADGGSVKVTEKYAYSDDNKPSPDHSVKDGRLTLKAEECEGFTRSSCLVNYKVLLPRSASVDLHTSGADITIRGTSGAIAAETSGGDITVEDSAARKAEVETSGGDVDVALTRVPDEVSGQTSGGDVTIRLPKGSYAVDASTSGGDRTVSVPTDDRSAHKVTAETSGGDVSVVNS
ncbi:DUF4097 family beta strand repeat-containing protein [Streptomyces halobius]|uniref:DUF4097 domain-containing protein n=1 Tax=Streptomyces halobius TaxID=2879846 RepID=A0ABY4MDL6_9ACTN|nr:DUF4097 family beta strand repeat-containing protein [Streptomyces halobius]UQA95553.1 DUF4097 domain-containing protein [Streptomyces halobius]